MLLRDTFTVNVLLICILNLLVTPGLAMIRTVCKYSRSILVTGIIFALVEKAIRLYREILMFFLHYLIELVEHDVWVSFSFDSSSTTGFVFNSLRVSLLTVLRVVRLPAHDLRALVFSL